MQDQTSHVGIDYNQKPWVTLPGFSTSAELDTAQTLVEMGTFIMQINATKIPAPTLECPATDTNDDAMDQIVGKLDVC